MQGDVKWDEISSVSFRLVQFLAVHVYSWSCISKLENHRNCRGVHLAISGRWSISAIEKVESRLKHPRCVVVSFCRKSWVGPLGLAWSFLGLSWVFPHLSISFHNFLLLTVTIVHSTSDHLTVWCRAMLAGQQDGFSIAWRLLISKDVFRYWR